MTCYIPRWFTHPQAVTHPSTNRAQCRLSMLIEANVLTTTLRRHHRLIRLLVTANYLSAFTLNRLDASWWTSSPAALPDTSFRGGVKHETQPHHARNVAQSQLKVDRFMPLDCSTVRDSLLRTVNARAQVLPAMVQRRSNIHLYNDTRTRNYVTLCQTGSQVTQLLLRKSQSCGVVWSSHAEC